MRHTSQEINVYALKHLFFAPLIDVLYYTHFVQTCRPTLISIVRIIERKNITQIYYEHTKRKKPDSLLIQAHKRCLRTVNREHSTRYDELLRAKLVCTHILYARVWLCLTFTILFFSWIFVLSFFLYCHLKNMYINNIIHIHIIYKFVLDTNIQKMAALQCVLQRRLCID